MTDDVNLIDYLRVLWKQRKVVIAITCISIIVTAAACSLLPPLYKASTTILLPEKRGATSALSSLVSNFDIPMPIDMQSSLFSRASNFKDILESETLAEMVVDGLNLERVFPDSDNKDSLVSHVRKMIKIKEKSGVLVVSVETRDPKLSRDVANYYILALDDYNQKNNVQLAVKTRVFIEEQLSEARADLAEAEERLQRFKSESMKVKVSERELVLARLLRDVRVKEALYTLLLQEWEKSKIEEARASQFFEVLDPAKLPRGQSRPKIKLNLAVSFLFGILLGAMSAFFLEYFEHSGAKIPSFKLRIGRKPHEEAKS